jgi:hypothetical protein
MFLKLKPEILEVIVKDFSEEISITSKYDVLVLKLDNKLLQLIQLTEPIEKNIPQNEQLKWLLNSKLEQPLEKYYYDFQIFQNEPELLAVGCAIAKEKLDNFFTKNNLKNVERIISEDSQFTFMKNKISLWQKKELLKKINKLGLLCLIFTGLVFTAIFFYTGRILSDITNNKNEIIECLNNMEKKADEAAAHALLEKNIKFNRKQNETLIRLIYRITAALPGKIFLTELKFNEFEGKIILSGYANTNTNFERALSTKLQQFKDIADVKIARTSLDHQRQIFEYELFLKNSQNIAEKTEAQNNG